MKVSGNQLRPGNIVMHNDKLWSVVKVQAVKPGKGGAFAQVELKGVLDGTKLNERFRSSQSVERVRLDQRQYQFIYADGDLYTFMDLESYDQVTLGTDVVTADKVPFLRDGITVTVEQYEERPISVTLPEHVTLEVLETDAVVKGQTAAASYKPATLENGVRVQVPPFITSGEKLVIDTNSLEYVRRADS